jgi:hypothetical protein
VRLKISLFYTASLMLACCAGVPTQKLQSMTLDTTTVNSGQYGGLVVMMQGRTQHEVIYVPCDLHVLNLTLTNGCDAAFGHRDKHDHDHPVNVLWRLCDLLRSHPHRTHELMREVVDKMPAEQQASFIHIGDTLPPEPVTTRWWTLVEAARWVDCRLVLVVALLERMCNAQAVIEGATTRLQKTAATTRAARGAGAGDIAHGVCGGLPQ